MTSWPASPAAGPTPPATADPAAGPTPPVTADPAADPADAEPAAAGLDLPAAGHAADRSGLPTDGSAPSDAAWLTRPAAAVDEAARLLLGWRITANGVTVRITEVEAYSGLGEDPASHAHRGVTPRNRVMFGPAGHLYVYQIYGMHLCANVVCGEDGRAAAVLLRAGEVVDGRETARSRRPAARNDADLAAGPAKLMQVLALTRDANGSYLLDGSGPAILTPPVRQAGQNSIGPNAGNGPISAEPNGTGPNGAGPSRAGPSRARANGTEPDRAGTDEAEVDETGALEIGVVVAGPRVGVTSAHDVPWRFWFRDDPTVSTYRRHVPRKRQAPRKA
nr:DNA-3-methyladenine glycosylase [Actinoplanes rectilineatus]